MIKAWDPGLWTYTNKKCLKSESIIRLSTVHGINEDLVARLYVDWAPRKTHAYENKIV